MKVLWLSHLVPYPPKGGVLQRAHHLLRELAKYHEIDLLAFNQVALMRPQFPSIDVGLAEAASFLGEVCRRFRILPLPIDEQWLGKERLALRSLVRQPYTIGWLASPEFRQAIRNWLDDRYDLVHFDTISLVHYFDEVASDIATVLDHHNIESSMLLRRSSNEKSWLKKAYYRQEGSRLRRFEQHYCARFSLNITCSDVDSADLCAIAPGSRVETVPNGVDTDYFVPGVEDPKPRLIFVGRLNWYPNAQAATFIAEQLWPLLKNRWPELEMDLVGANPPDAAVSLAKRDASFKVHGFVDDVRPLLSRATAYVCPIVDGGGTKLKVLDALAMGKPLIAHPIACEGIDVTEGKDVLFARTPHDYLTHLAELLSDERRRRNLGGAARKLVESCYAYPAIGKQLSAFCEQAVEATRGRH